MLIQLSHISSYYYLNNKTQTNSKNGANGLRPGRQLSMPKERERRKSPPADLPPDDDNMGPTTPNILALCCLEVA